VGAHVTRKASARQIAAARPGLTLWPMPRSRPIDFEDEVPTRVEAPLPTRYHPETRTYELREDALTESRRERP
jgi:hypothetical protein